MSGLRERKKAETRAALSWAAISLTVERGFENVKVEDIAAAADVSPRTFNNYFASKAEAIVSRQVERSRRAAGALRTRPPEEPLWTAIINAALDQLVAGPEVDDRPVTDRDRWLAGLRLMLTEPALQAEMMRAAALTESEMAAAIAERTGTDATKDMYPNLVAAAVTAATNVATQQYLRAGSTDPGMEVLLPQALSLVAAGLPVP